MGHANVSNISNLFVNRLYAKGKLSIAECVAALSKAGETVHASEGEYDDESMLGLMVVHVIHYLTRKDPTRHGYSGPRRGGPWIEPALTAWLGKRRSVTSLTRRLLDEIEAGSNEVLTICAAADRLLEEGFDAWSVAVRLLPRQREVLAEWEQDKDDAWDRDEDNPNSKGILFDHIPWRFARGWRKRYRDVPRLSNITN